MRKIFLVIAICIFSQTFVKADEGMWMLHLLKTMNEAQMKKLGLNLTAEELYSEENASIKDAIVNFGGFCTGSVISKNGLVLTNHHCGYDAVQSLSSEENNYLKKGFWADSPAEEKPCNGLFVRFLVSMKDVTSVLKPLYDSEDEDKYKLIAAAEDSLITLATENTHYEGEVEAFYNGNQYMLFTYERFTDIRLVGVPPEFIGKYGGDTDNWMWPRHTGDFSMFRIYMGEDGKPAPYSESNVAYAPKKYLKVSTKGVKKGDFSMVLGYPGSTERYLTSFDIETLRDEIRPVGVELRTKRLAIMKSFMSQSDKIDLMYSAKYAHISNYHKNWQGQLNSFEKRNIIDQKLQFEDKFNEWVYKDADRKKKYSDVLGRMEELQKEKAKIDKMIHYINEAAFAAEAMEFAYGFQDLINSLDGENTEQVIDRVVASSSEHFENYVEAIDKYIFKYSLQEYLKGVPNEALPNLVNELSGKYKGDISKFVDKIYEKSFLTNVTNFKEFLGKFKMEKLEEDPLLVVLNDILDNFRAYLKTKRDIRKEYGDLQALYMAGVMEMQNGKPIYPDANFTMRLTYGTVKDYLPRDAVKYDYITTEQGILAKEDKNNPEEFFLDKKFKTLLQTKKFGDYGDTSLIVNFISDNDITGGNSGSPVIDANGDLIGLAFDGNWEAMSSDYIFESDMQRCINVDIRYILFVVDKYAGASHLVKELDLVK